MFLTACENPYLGGIKHILLLLSRMRTEKVNHFFSIFHDYSSTALFVHENRATSATHR